MDDAVRALIEALPEAVVLHRRGALAYMNPSARELLGYSSSAEVAGKPAMDLVHPDHRLEARAVGLFDMVPAPPNETRFVRRDGSVVAVDVSSLATVFEGEPAILAL